MVFPILMLMYILYKYAQNDEVLSVILPSV